MIQVNEKLPSAQCQYFADGEMQTVDVAELVAGKKCVLFALPGAFTPTCSNAHLPGYVVKADEFAAKGVDLIICTSVNDAFVMDAWGKAQNAESIVMLGDGGAELANALGLSFDTGVFGGVRSKRYAMVIEEGVVTQLNVEQPKEFKVSDAETILNSL